MDRITYPQWERVACSFEDLQYASLKNKVDTYNASVGEDDGTGIQCDICKNRGVLALISDAGTFATKPCKCRGTRITTKRLIQQGIFKRSQSSTLESFLTDTPLRKTLHKTVMDFLEDPDFHWLMMCGQSGAGKTHLCTAAFTRLSYDRGLDGRYFLWNSDGRKTKAAAVEGNERVIDGYKKCPLLYIDDLFKCRRGVEPSDADLRLAFEILDYRSENKLITIISSELDFSQLLMLDEALASRIKQMCGPYLANISRDTSKNYRFDQ